MINNGLEYDPIDYYKGVLRQEFKDNAQEFFQGIAKESKVDKEENFKNGVLPKLCISGCQSSCAAHQTGRIGFKGGKKKVDNVLTDVFDVFYGGNEIQGKERFGEVLGTVEADNIPEMLRKLGKEIQTENSTFENWIINNESRFVDIIKEYSI